MYRKIILSVFAGSFYCIPVLAQNIAINTTGTAAAAANMLEVTQAGGNNTVGIFSSHTGTGTNAYAIWAAATGATNKYAIVVPPGGGSVGIGTTTPGTLLHIFSSDATPLQVKAEQTNTTTLSQIIATGENANAFIYIRQGNSGLPGTTYGNMPLSGSLVSGTSNTNGLILNSANATAPMVFVTGGSTLSNERMRIEAGGNTGIGTTAPQNTLHVLSNISNITTNPHPYRTGIMVEGDQNTLGGRVAIRQAGTNPCMTFYRNNGTIAAPTTLISGDMIGNLAFGGYDGSSVIASPGITAVAAETWAPTDNGWHLTFNTINIGSGGSTEKMRLNSEGYLGVGTSTPVWDVDVTKANASGGVIVNAQNTSAGANASAGFMAQNDASKWGIMSLGSSTATTTTFGLVNANMTNFLSNTTVALGNSTNNPIIFGTNNLERMRLLGNGTFKITGTAITSPGIWMEGSVTAAAGTAYGILSRGTLIASANNEGFFPFSNHLGTVNTGTYTGLGFYGGHFDGSSWTKTGTGTIANGYGIYVTAPTIATNNYAASFTGGNVGVGTTTPASRLEVVNTAGGYVSSNYLQITGTTADNLNYPGLSMKGGTLATTYPSMSLTNGGLGAVIYSGTAAGFPNQMFGLFDAGGSFIQFGKVGSPYMTINSAGNVGIGTITPDTKLHVAGGNGTTLKIVDTNQGTGKVLVSDANGVASWAPLGSLTALNNNQTVYTASTSWVIPAGIYKVNIELWGGGGGGTGSMGEAAACCISGAGGGSGEYVRDIVSVTPGSTYYITVGGGGGGGAGAPASSCDESSGAAGGNSCFSTGAGCTGTILARAFGGSGGTANVGCLLPTGGAGGTGGTGFQITGGPGATPVNDGATSNPGGNGGSSTAGAGAVGVINAVGTNGTAPGGGGSGGGSRQGNLAGYAGGSGAIGRVVVIW